MSIIPFDIFGTIANFAAASDYFWTRLMYYTNKGFEIPDAVPKALIDAGAKFVGDGIERFLRNLGHFTLEQWKVIQQ